MGFDVVEFVKSELVGFTGLPRAAVDDYVARKKHPTHINEWMFWKPDTPKDIRWFYVASRAYLFANAVHRVLPKVKDRVRPGEQILDLGGGSGNSAFDLAQMGCEVQYFELNLLQREFVRHVVKKHELAIQIIEPDENFLPQWRPRMVGADVALAIDVLEHIPDYRPYVKGLAEACMHGAAFYVAAPFASGEPAHLKDAHNLTLTLKKNGFVPEVDHWRYEGER